MNEFVSWGRWDLPNETDSGEYMHGDMFGFWQILGGRVLMSYLYRGVIFPN